MIDFGLATKYLDDNGEHLPQKKQSFKGNVAFCSHTALMRLSTSRRDDVMLLLNLIYYLLTAKFYGADEFIESYSK